MPIAIRKIFLQWLPWVLRMAPNGVPLTKKSITLQNKVRLQDISVYFVYLEKSAYNMMDNKLIFANHNIDGHIR